MLGAGISKERGVTLLTWFKCVLLSVFSFVAPIKPLMIGSLVAVLFDTVTGVMAARKRGERISSAGLRRTISKGFVYSATILVGYVIQHTLMDDVLPVAKLIAGAIGAVELKSCLENASVVLGQPLFKALLGKLGSANDPTKAKGTGETDVPRS